MSKIRPWEKIGTLEVLAEKFGKKFISQWFKNPATGKEEEFVLFGQKDWSVVLPITEDEKVVAESQYKQGCHQILL